MIAVVGPRAPRLTLRRLHAIEAALSAMLAGDQGSGDWPPEIDAADVNRAHNWVCDQIERRRKRFE